MVIKSTFKMPTLESVAEKINQKPQEEQVNQIVEKKEVVIKDLVLEEVQKVWDDLALAKDKEGKINEHILLSNRKIEIKDNLIIKFAVDNAFQADYLNVFKTELIDHLRTKLGHPTLYIEYTVEKKEGKSNNMYTPTEKYTYLVQKYPHLLELKQKLGLDLDF